MITSCINQLIVSERDGLISTPRGLAERQDSDLHQWSSSSYYLPTVKLITTKWSSDDHRLKSEKSSEWDGLWTKWHLLWLWGDNMEPRRPSLVKMSSRVRQIWGKYIEKGHIEKMARIGEKWEDLSEAMGGEGGGGGGGGWGSEVKNGAFWGSALVWFWVRRLKWSEAMEGGGGGQTKMEKWSHTLGQGSRGVMRAAGRIVAFFDAFSPRCYIHLTSDSVWWWWRKKRLKTFLGVIWHKVDRGGGSCWWWKMEMSEAHSRILTPTQSRKLRCEDNVHRGCTAVVIMSQSQSKRKKLLMVKNENVRILTHRTIKKATVRRWCWLWIVIVSIYNNDNDNDGKEVSTL